MVLSHSDKKPVWHERKKRQEVEFEHVRRTYSTRKPIVVQCRVQRSRVMERNVVGILPVTGKTLQDCLCLQAIPKECVRYRWSVLFHMKFDVSHIPEDILMPSSTVGDQFQFVYADSRKNGRIVGTSELFTFGLEDDFTESSLSKMKKGNSVNTPYLQLQLNSNWNNNNATTPEDEDGAEMHKNGSVGSEKGDEEGNLMMLPIDEEDEVLDLPAAIENMTAAPDHGTTGEILKSAPSTEDEYVFLDEEEDVTQDANQGHNRADTVIIDDANMKLKDNDDPVFGSTYSSEQTSIKEIDDVEKSSIKTEPPVTQVNEELKSTTKSVDETIATDESVMHVEQQTSKTQEAAVESTDSEEAVAQAVKNETNHDMSPDRSINQSWDETADDGAVSDNQTIDNDALPGPAVNNDPATTTQQYVQYTTADGEVCWAIANATVPVAPTNQQLAVDLFNVSERLCYLETQWGQWIPYLNSRIDHLTNSHQLLFDDCKVQKANISDLSERIQSNGQRDSWTSRQQERRYGGSYRNRNSDRERRYNEESREIVGYYEYYNSQFNNRFGQGRGRGGQYRRDHRYNRQDGQQRGYYQQNRQYESSENNDIEHNVEENESAEDGKKCQMQNVKEMQGQENDEVNKKEEKVVITPHKS